MEKAKKKLEIELAVQRQAKDKLADQNNTKEEEVRQKMEEIKALIQEKVELEQQLQHKQGVLHKVEGALKDKKEF